MKPAAKIFYTLSIIFSLILGLVGVIVGFTGVIKGLVPDGYSPEEAQIIYTLFVVFGIGSLISFGLSIAGLILVLLNKQNKVIHILNIVIGFLFGVVFEVLGGIFSLVSISKQNG